MADLVVGRKGVPLRSRPGISPRSLSLSPRVCCVFDMVVAAWRTSIGAVGGGRPSSSARCVFTVVRVPACLPACSHILFVDRARQTLKRAYLTPKGVPVYICFALCSFLEASRGRALPSRCSPPVGSSAVCVFRESFFCHI